MSEENQDIEYLKTNLFVPLFLWPPSKCHKYCYARIAIPFGQATQRYRPKDMTISAGAEVLIYDVSHKVAHNNSDNVRNFFGN